MKLQRDFFERNTLLVARELLGKRLVHETKEGITVGKISEVEAYIGPDDDAAHTYKSLITNRTKVVFGPGGYAYVFIIYGMYNCFNIVTNTSGNPECVLIRGLEPLDGIDLMKNRRNTDKVKNLCNGPGKLCQAMSITKANNGDDLCSSKLYLLDSIKIPDCHIETTPRINIDYAQKAKDYPWRFVINQHKSSL